jgi:cysteinyl-tRNA synthetase
VDGQKMSKSKGNVYYPKDLEAKGYSGSQIRFFLIYGCYHETLDFTFEKLAEVSRKLDALRAVICDLQKSRSNTASDEVKVFSKKIISGFEAAMNNNLDTKTAFDSLTETVNNLYAFKDKISVEDKEEIFRSLRRVDSVLQCLF